MFNHRPGNRAVAPARHRILSPLRLPCRLGAGVPANAWDSELLQAVKSEDWERLGGLLGVHDQDLGRWCLHGLNFLPRCDGPFEFRLTTGCFQLCPRDGAIPVFGCLGVAAPLPRLHAGAETDDFEWGLGIIAGSQNRDMVARKQHRIGAGKQTIPAALDGDDEAPTR